VLKYRLITGPILIIALLALIWADNRMDALVLSDFWSGVSQLNPLVYVVNAFRYGSSCLWQPWRSSA